MILVRARAWWFNKVPLSVTLVLLLLDGRPFTLTACAVLLLVVLAVCAVGNYGYALNELFDIEEDARIGRDNVAARVGRKRMWCTVILSAMCAMVFSALAGGLRGAALTAAALCLPPAYSVPPIRLKERKWLAAFADALAAHVYPAMLALCAIVHQAVRPIGILLAVCVAVWSASAGLRGILSHLLHTAEQDRKAALQTVVADLGAATVERCVVAVLLPLEACALTAALVLCNTGPLLWCGFALYCAYEAYKTASGRFRVTAFRPQGQRYIPLVEESFYKVWAPLILAADAARAGVLYLALIPVYVLLFRPHLRIELDRFRSVAVALRS